MSKAPEMSHGQAASARIVAALAAGELAPGDRLREIELGERLGLSRTPVREALRMLEADGIVAHVPRIGATVRKLEQAEIVQLYEMRTVLERTAAGMAARHGAPAEIDELDATNAEIAAAANDPTSAAALNQRFHRTLYHAARNRFLLDAARSLNNALMLLGPTTLDDAERIATVVAQHRAIVDALRGGDPVEAGAAAELHLQTSLRHRLRGLAR